MPVSSSSTHAGLQRLIERVGEYVGYEDAPRRQQSDIAVRRHLTTNIRRILEQLDRKFNSADVADHERLESLISSTRRKLNTICTSLNNPTYQQAAFFSGKRLSARETARIYDLESNMVEETENICKEVIGLKKETVSRAEFEDHFLHIQNFVDNINQFLFEREALIVGDL
jgi:hypothetical protein